MSLLTRTALGIALCALTTPGILTAPVSSWAQQPSYGSQTGSATRAPLSREEILQSARWQKLRHSFEKWLSVQKLYTPAEVAQLKAALNLRISSMTAEQLEDFVLDSEDRLDALMSNEATEARAWLGFLTPQARKKQLARLGANTSVFDMTGDQLRQDLHQFEQLRGSDASAQAAYNRSQEQRAREARVDRQARDKDQVAARERMAAGNERRFEANHAPYRPLPGGPTAAGSYNNTYGARPAMWVNPWGGISRPLW